MQEQHPNMKVIQTFFQAYSSGDMEQIAGILSPDIEWVIPGRHPLSGTKKGIPESSALLIFFDPAGAIRIG
jgi:ketosteroid isomerase-like protein